MSKKVSRSLKYSSGESVAYYGFVKGFLFEDIDGDKEYREEVMKLAEDAEKGTSRAQGQFFRLMQPWRGIGISVPVFDQEVIFKKINTSQCQREASTLEKLFKKEYLEGWNTLKVNKKKYDVDAIIFVGDVHLNSVKHNKSQSDESFFKDFEKKLKSALSMSDCENGRVLLVFLGDLTDFGTVAEFYLFKILLARLSKLGFKNIAFVPGNHDVSAFYGSVCNSVANCKNFAEILLGCEYKNKEFVEMILEDDEMKAVPVFPLRINLGRVDLVLLDSNSLETNEYEKSVFHTANGSIGEDQLKRLGTTIGMIENENDLLLGLHHHPVPNTELTTDVQTMLGDVKLLMKVIKGKKSEVVCGHLHTPFRRTIKDEKSKSEVVVRSVGSLRYGDDVIAWVCIIPKTNQPLQWRECNFKE